MNVIGRRKNATREIPGHPPLSRSTNKKPDEIFRFCRGSHDLTEQQNSYIETIEENS